MKYILDIPDDKLSNFVWQNELYLPVKFDTDTIIQCIATGLKLIPYVVPDISESHVAIGMSKSGGTMWYECEQCHTSIDLQDKYCRGCGRRLVRE